MEVFRIIRSDGVIRAPIKAVADHSLRQMQGRVGGWIEEIPLTKHLSLIVNEEGLLKGLPPNATATAVVCSKLPELVQTFPNFAIVGDALLVRSNEGKLDDSEQSLCDELTVTGGKKVK